VRVDCRVVAATHVDLRQAAADGRFREDLFYRLNVIEIRIPPLRERTDDIPLLAQHFVERFSHELNKDISGLSDGALKVIMDHAWPGNVRELENAVERAMVTCRNHELTEADFAFLVRPGVRQTVTFNLQDMEKATIIAAIERAGGNIKETASMLGIDRSTLYEKIKKYEIPR